MSADTPRAGYYRHTLVKRGHPVGIRIWYGAPHDPETGEEMDRSFCWQAECNGEPIDINRVWPWCGDDEIDAQEYEYFKNAHEWGKAHAPDSPQANPRKPIDKLSSPILF